MMGLVIIQGVADQGQPLDYARDALISATPCALESLTAVNKGTDSPYIQLFDARAIVTQTVTSSNGLPALTNLSGHTYTTGDRVSTTVAKQGGGSMAGFVGVVSTTVFQIYDTLVEALNASGTPQAAGNSSGGVSTLVEQDGSTLIPEEYPILAAASAPSNVLSYMNGRFRKGCYVRAVTAINGSTLITNADVKFTPRYRASPAP